MAFLNILKYKLTNTETLKKDTAYKAMSASVIKKDAGR